MRIDSLDPFLPTELTRHTPEWYESKYPLFDPEIYVLLANLSKASIEDLEAFLTEKMRERRDLIVNDFYARYNNERSSEKSDSLQEADISELKIC